MQFEVFVEEPSAAVALQVLLPRILGPDHGFQLHEHRGKADLLKNLPARLRAYPSWASRVFPTGYVLVILADSDGQDCRRLKSRLVRLACEAGVGEVSLVRLAVEELEAWFFGDPTALRAVFPRLPDTLEQRRAFRDPDAVRGGTWEALDRLLKDHGYSQGLVKTDAARAIAGAMDPDRNRSRSFQVFRDGLRTRAGG